MQFHYAENTARPDSDIDIAVIVDKLEGDYMDELAKLYKLRRSVDFRIEPVLFEYGQHKSGFLKEIMDTGYVLYPSAAWQQTNRYSAFECRFFPLIVPDSSRLESRCFALVIRTVRS